MYFHEGTLETRELRERIACLYGLIFGIYM